MNLFKEYPDEWVKMKLEKASEAEKLLFFIRCDLRQIRESEESQKFVSLVRMKTHYEVKSHRYAKVAVWSFLTLPFILVTYWYLELDFIENVLLFSFLTGNQLGFLIVLLLLLGIEGRIFELDEELASLEKKEVSNSKTSVAHVLDGVFRDFR